LACRRRDILYEKKFKIPVPYAKTTNLANAATFSIPIPVLKALESAPVPVTIIF